MQSKPLSNLYTQFNVNTLRYCEEMACADESLHTFGNSDITIHRRREQIRSVGAMLCRAKRCQKKGGNNFAARSAAANFLKVHI